MANNHAQPQPGALGRKQSTAIRKSARLQEKERLRRQLGSKEQVHQRLSPTNHTPGVESPRDSSVLAGLSNPDRKRKRKRKRSHGTDQNYEKDEPGWKRQRASPAVQDTSSTGPTSGSSNNNIHLQHWIQEGRWPQEYFEQDSNMSHWLTRKRSTPSLSNKQSETINGSFREGKSPAVTSRHYEQLLASAGIYMGQPEPHLRLTDAGKVLCQKMFNTEQPIPKDSLFEDDLFESTCEDIANRNEARVIQDIGRLIVPSPEELARRGATHLKNLIENVNERWIKSIPLVNGPCPQPDFSAGLKSTAFTRDQLQKLGPYVGGWQTTSRLAATNEMYFPFLTSEVKCGNEALRIADRQNAHSASVAANAVVELYKAVSRQDELHREVLAFSVSHDHDIVKIYGHYPLINGKDTSFYRYLIRHLSITYQDGKDKWTAYKFTRNVYSTFVPLHLKRIQAAVDQLPGPEAFLVKPLSQQPNAESVENDNQSTPSYSQESAVRLPSSKTTEPVVKKPKGKSAR